jgi:malate dehydrogenase (oxaloacetate-decarboxylating)(NADP+)
MISTIGISPLLTSPLAPAVTATVRIPPHFFNSDHRQRCLAQLRTKSLGLEQYIFLNGLKERDPNLFYEVLLDNMMEIIPILYTPTVTRLPLLSLISD